MDKDYNMQTVPVYLYHNMIICQMDDNSGPSHTRSIRVYANPIKVYKNVDNPIRLVFKNKDQKRIRITDYTFELFVFGTNSPTAQQILVSDTEYDTISVENIDIAVPVISKPLSILDDGVSDALKGIAQVTLTAEDLSGLPADSYTYTVRATNINGETLPVYSDDNLNVSGTIAVATGAYPASMLV